MRAPRSKMEPASDLAGAANASPLQAKYGTRLEGESARELLAARLAQAAEPDAKPVKRTPKPKAAKQPASSGDPVTDFLTSKEGQRLGKEVVRGVFGLLKKRL
jgi:hypothetical protein